MAKDIQIKFTGDPASLKKAATESATAVEGMGTKLGKVATIASGFVVGSALTSLPGKLLGMAQAAADDEASVLRLKTAVDNSGVSFDASKKAIEDRIKAGQDLAFSDDETRTALTLLISETGSYEEGMSRLTAAQDLARGAGISLEAASKVLGKTSDENTATLKRYGISLGENATAQDVMNAVDAKFGGQAAAFAQTGAADMLKLKDQVGEAQEQLGAYLLPAIVAVTGVLITLVGVLQADVIPVIGVLGGFIKDNLTPILLAAAPVIVAIGVAILSSAIPAFVAWTTALYAQVVAWLALNASMLPIIGIAVLIGAAIVLLYEAWSHNFLGIQDITQQVIDFVMPYITTAMETIQKVFDTVLPYIQTIFEFYVTAWTAIVTTGFGAIQTVIETVWPIIQKVFEVVFPIIQGIIDTYITAWIGIITTGFAAIQSVIETVWPIIQTIIEVGMTAIQTAIDLGMAAIQLLWGPAWDAIKAVVDAIWSVATGIVSVVQIGIDAVKAAIDTVMALLRTAWETAWGGIKGVLSDYWDATTGIVHVVTGGIQDVYDAITGKLATLKEYWDTFWNGLKGKVDTVVDAVKEVWNAVAGTVNSGLGIAGTAINLLIDGYNKIPFHDDIGHVYLSGLIPTFGDAGSSGSLPGIHGGGGGGPDAGGGGPGSGPGLAPVGGAPGGGIGVGGGGGPGPGGGGGGPGTSVPGLVNVPILGGFDALAGLGNLSNSGGLPSGGGSGRTAAYLTAEGEGRRYAAAQLVASGVPVDTAVAVANADARQAGDIYSQGGTLSSFMAANGGNPNGLKYTDPQAYADRVGGVLLESGLIGYANVGGDGHGIHIHMDGHKVGVLTGRRHVREARMQKSPLCS